MFEDLDIGEPKDRPAQTLQLGLSQMIPQNHLVETVDPAVDLHDEPQAIAGEVGDVAADRMLSAEPVSVDPSRPQPFP